MATKKSNGTSITSLFENIEEKGFGELGAEDLARLRRVGRRAKLGEDVRRRTRGQHLHDGGHERARRRARDTPPTGDPRQGTGALRDPTGREYREW